MPSNRQQLIDSLVQRRLYPKKKKKEEGILNPEQPITGTVTEQPILQQPIQLQAQKQAQLQAAQLQAQKPLPEEKKGIPLSKRKFTIPEDPLQKILFLKRTIGI